MPTTNKEAFKEIITVSKKDFKGSGVEWKNHNTAMLRFVFSPNWQNLRAWAKQMGILSLRQGLRLMGFIADLIGITVRRII